MDPQQQFFKALAALRDGDLEGCESICQHLLRINPKEVNSLRLQAQVWHKRGELERAESGFKAALSIANDFAHAWADLGKVQFSLEKYPLAEQSLRRALQLNSTLKAANKLLAEVLEKQGKTTQSAAVKQVNQQHRLLKEKVIEAYRLSAGRDEAAQKNGPERGEALCKEVLQVDPEHVGAKEFLINRALESGRARWAEELARSLVRKMPEQSKWWLKLSSALARQDQLVEAQQAVQQVLSIEPELEEAQMLLGSIFARDNRFAEALGQYDAVLQQNPANIAALAQKGSALKTLGRQDESIQCLRRCLELDSSFGEAAWSLSNLKTYRFSDREVTTIEGLLANQELKDKDVVHFNYALGKAYEHRQQWVRRLMPIRRQIASSKNQQTGAPMISRLRWIRLLPPLLPNCWNSIATVESMTARLFLFSACRALARRCKSKYWRPIHRWRALASCPIFRGSPNA